MADKRKGEMVEDGNTAPVTAPVTTPAPTTPPAALTTTQAAPVAPLPGVDPSQWITTIAPTPGPAATTPLPTPEKTYAMNPKEAAATQDLKEFALYMRGLADKGELVDDKGNKLPMYSADKIEKMTPAELFAFMQNNPGYAKKYFASIGKPGGGVGMYGGAGESGQVVLPGGGGGKEAPKAEAKKTEPVPPIPTPAPTAKETQDPDFWGKLGKIAETLGTGILGAYQAYMAGYAGLTDPNAYFYQTQRQEKIRKETEAEAKAKEEREREFMRENMAIEQKYRLESMDIENRYQQALQASTTAEQARQAALDRAQQLEIAKMNLAVEREKIGVAGGTVAGGDLQAAMLSGNLPLPAGATSTGSTVAPTAATAATAPASRPLTPAEEAAANWNATLGALPLVGSLVSVRPKAGTNELEAEIARIMARTDLRPEDKEKLVAAIRSKAGVK